MDKNNIGQLCQGGRGKCKLINLEKFGEVESKVFTITLQFHIKASTLETLAQVHKDACR